MDRHDHDDEEMNELVVVRPNENRYLLAWVGRGLTSAADLAKRLAEPVERTESRIACLSEHGLLDVAADGSCHLAWRVVFSEGDGKFRLDIEFADGTTLILVQAASLLEPPSP